MSPRSRLNQIACTFDLVRASTSMAPCPHCFAPAPRYWEADRVALDAALDRVAVLQVRVGVHRCTPCRRYFRSQPPFLRRDATYTNRVVTTAVQAVLADGMAVRRVTARLARDLWVRPSEATIRGWCRTHTQPLSLDGDYLAWVAASFSGILCVDEVYQDRLALLLAVDPRTPDGDRLVGYQLVHGAVDQADITAFLARLRDGGITPAQVVTDGSALYPTVLAKVWPQAAHQLCLFHETRAVVRAVAKVVDHVRRALPKPPVARGRRGRLRVQYDPAGPSTADRAARIALARRLRREGFTIREIVRQTGHSRNAVRAWLRHQAEVAPPPAAPPSPRAAVRRAIDRAVAQRLHREGLPVRAIMTRTGRCRNTIKVWLRQATPAAPTTPDPPPAALPAPAPPLAPPAPPGAVATAPLPGELPPCAPPPAPWPDWDTVRAVRATLRTWRYRLGVRSAGLTADERAQLDTLLASPAGEPLRVAHDFAQHWYAIWSTADGARRPVEEARPRFEALRAAAGAATLAPLRRMQARMDAARFTHLSHFLRDPTWEATSNGAERMGRQVRHLQAPRFGLRTPAALAGVLTAHADQRRASEPARVLARAGRATRGRPRRASSTAQPPT